MIVQSKKPLSMAEAKSYVKDGEESKVMLDYLKAFTKLKKADAEKLSEEIRALNNPKIKEENIMKVVDLLPVDSEDLNKIFVEVSLSEEEINTILGIIKKYQ